MSAAFQRVVQQNQTALKEGVAIVRNIIAKNPPPTGYTTLELYKLAIKEQPSPEFKPPTQHTIPTRPKLDAKGQIKQATPSPEPPNPTHPVRSMTFLKHNILPFLEGRRELQKTRAERILAHTSLPTKNVKKGKPAPDGPATETVWVWAPADPNSWPKQSTTAPPKEVYGEDLGVGEDLSHLSKRRERARRAKIRADVHAMKVAEGIARQKVKSEAGAALRRKQAEQAARREKREAEARAKAEVKVKAAAPLRRTSAPQVPRAQAPSSLFAKRTEVPATSRPAREENFMSRRL
ncbi:hypothetical protein D9615_004954 [Tricholomella constricta]|uniref:Uncharacterized protein n=1 Tax=Tricholomella constricta TaxID=117010 RepID=A0A8H5M743_9AGAR|nr:hypothetical protein D9615_004954 [Tricholomella constricta]